MNNISDKEAALLGLLSEKPKHAYEIESDIKERDMRYWTEISMSSVYKLLNKLEKRRLLKSAIKLSAKNVVQKVYALTPKGKKAFKDKLVALASAWQPSIHPIDISLAHLNVLSRAAAVSALSEYSKSLDKMLVCYTELESYLVEHKCHKANVQLATRRLHLLRGEKTWLAEFIKSYGS
jgi:DNA-binding PadR family transcriptional regulator